MGAKNLGELVTWQLADRFRSEVTALVLASPGASRDYRYRGQLLEAASGVASNVAEGFSRRWPLDFARFLDYAISGLAESESRLKDGVLRRYFTEEDCRAPLRTKRRCSAAARRLREDRINEARRQRERRKDRRLGRPPDSSSP